LEEGLERVAEAVLGVALTILLKRGEMEEVQVAALSSNFVNARLAGTRRRLLSSLRHSHTLSTHKMAASKDKSTVKPPAKKQKRVPPPSSSSDEVDSARGGGESDDDASDASSSKSKPVKKVSKGKGKAAPKKDKKKEGKTAKGKGKKRKAESDEDDFIAKSGSEEEEDDDGDSSDGGLNTRVVGSTKKVAGPTENGSFPPFSSSIRLLS
jgi:hypothetical protein